MLQWVCLMTSPSGAGDLIKLNVPVGNSVYALTDPFSQAVCLALSEIYRVSVWWLPLYLNKHFSLATGRCLEDKDQKAAGVSKQN